MEALSLNGRVSAVDPSPLSLYVAILGHTSLTGLTPTQEEKEMSTVESEVRPVLNPEANPYLRPSEVAVVLGVSLSNVYKMIRSGALPAVPFGGGKSTRVLTADLRRFLHLDAVSA